MSRIQRMGGDGIHDIHTQLAHLKWRKSNNDAKIRSSITTSRVLAERDLLIQLSENRARARAVAAGRDQRRAHQAARGW